jgi:hypothetical protein
MEHRDEDARSRASALKEPRTKAAAREAARAARTNGVHAVSAMAEVERAKATAASQRKMEVVAAAAMHEEGAVATSGETAYIVRGVSRRQAALADEKGS